MSQRIIYNRYFGELWMWMIFIEFIYHSAKITLLT